LFRSNFHVDVAFAKSLGRKTGAEATIASEEKLVPRSEIVAHFPAGMISAGPPLLRGVMNARAVMVFLAFIVAHDRRIRES
jgi:hypothetical protein